MIFIQGCVPNYGNGDGSRNIGLFSPPHADGPRDSAEFGSRESFKSKTHDTHSEDLSVDGKIKSKRVSGK
jgi:hypothetical protein